MSATWKEVRDGAAVQAMAALVSNPQASQYICNSDPRYKKQKDGMFNFKDVVAMNAVEFANALVDQLKKEANL